MTERKVGRDGCDGPLKPDAPAADRMPTGRGVCERVHGQTGPAGGHPIPQTRVITISYPAGDEVRNCATLHYMYNRHQKV